MECSINKRSQMVISTDTLTVYVQIKRAANAALKFKNIKKDQLSTASFFLSGKPIAAASFTS